MIKNNVFTKIFIITLGLIVVVTGAILVMAMWGWLGLDKHQIDIWVEICSQILNGIFTFAAICTHPFRSQTLYRILKLGNKKDSNLFQKVQDSFPDIPIVQDTDIDIMASQPYVSYIPLYKIKHIMLLLNLNCITQYPITAVMWIYHYSTRPIWVIIVFLPLSFLSGSIGNYYLFRLTRTSKKPESIVNDMEYATCDVASV